MKKEKQSRFMRVIEKYKDVGDDMWEEKEEKYCIKEDSVILYMEKPEGYVIHARARVFVYVFKRLMIKWNTPSLNQKINEYAREAKEQYGKHIETTLRKITKHESEQRVAITVDWNLLNLIMANCPEARVAELNKQKQKQVNNQ